MGYAKEKELLQSFSGYDFILMVQHWYLIWPCSKVISCRLVKFVATQIVIRVKWGANQLIGRAGSLRKSRWLSLVANQPVPQPARTKLTETVGSIVEKRARSHQNRDRSRLKLSIVKSRTPQTQARERRTARSKMLSHYLALIWQAIFSDKAPTVSVYNRF